MTLYLPRLRRLAIALVLSACACLAHAQSGAADKAELLRHAEQLLAGQKPQNAYELLLDAEERFGGDADFNLSLGRAALAAGKPAEAVFALERALVIKPDFPQARAELGRAYFLLGENASAKAELNAARRQDLPAEVDANLQKFLDAIESRFDASGRRLEYYVKLGVGNDSNINSAPDLTDVVIPLFANLGPAPLDENSREMDSPYTELEPGIRFSNPLSTDLNFYASADVNLRTAMDAGEFSTRTINGVIGLGKLAGSNQYRVALLTQSFAVDGATYRDQTGVSGEWQRTLTGNDRLSVFLQYADLAYPDAPFRDGNQTSAGVSWLRSFGSGVFYGSVYLGDEEVDDGARQFLARDFTGLRIGGQWNLRRTALFANLNFLQSEYGAPDTLFLTTRKDDYQNLDIGMQIPLGSSGRVDWRLTPLISMAVNDSNIDVYEFDRTVIGITAQADF